MDILQYNELDAGRHAKAFARVVELLRAGDFRAANVKKLAPTPYYRAELSAADRLLFRFARYGDRTYLLLLELIENHAYEKSRFLNGAAVDEARLTTLPAAAAAPAADVLPLHYVNPQRPHIHVLDKMLSFDDPQHAVLHARPPLILIGTAGSGKTVLMLEKMKQLSGDILYVTRSPFLVENSRNLYYSHRYDNDRQDVQFLSFREFLESIRMPEGRPVGFRAFAGWFARHRPSSPIKDAHMLFEEFSGVLTGASLDRPFLGREDYLSLGVRRSIFAAGERPAVYDLFEKYRRHLAEAGFYDPNLEAHRALACCAPRYDFAVVDEVQDLTNIQLYLALRSLRRRSDFILCGDSNQIVHPNFFSWANLKTMFYEEAIGEQADVLRILNTNYRNSPQITETANRLLQIKHARFGSVDRESNYLVRCHTETPGTVELLADDDRVRRELNGKTRRSTRFAVMVLREEDKAEARRHFDTPLVFCIQEAKGLEYESIILFNLISDSAREFADVAAGVSVGDLQGEWRYARAKDKADKSLDAYKFYINALYVAVTRAIRNLYLIERQGDHALLALMGLRSGQDGVQLAEQQSSADEWQAEARRLELQGKQEQADEIRRTILSQQPVPWRVLTPATLPELEKEAFQPEHYNKQAKLLLFEYAVTYAQWPLLARLEEFKFQRAASGLHDLPEIQRKYEQDYHGSVFPELKRKVALYGPNFRNALNQTPLMIAARRGLGDLIGTLIRDGADPNLRDNGNRAPLQIALCEAFRSVEFARAGIGAAYELLAPSSLKVRVDGRLVKIDRHRMEYFVLQCMIATMPDILRAMLGGFVPGFQTGDIIGTLAHYPDRVIPAHRRCRQAITAALAGNEAFRDTPNNRRLFVRTIRGRYVPNPRMDIEIGDEWINVYTLAGFDRAAPEFANQEGRRFAEYLDTVCRDLDKVYGGDGTPQVAPAAAGAAEP